MQNHNRNYEYINGYQPIYNYVIFYYMWLLIINVCD